MKLDQIGFWSEIKPEKEKKYRLIIRLAILLLSGAMVRWYGLSLKKSLSKNKREFATYAQKGFLLHS